VPDVDSPSVVSDWAANTTVVSLLLVESFEVLSLHDVKTKIRREASMMIINIKKKKCLDLK